MTSNPAALIACESVLDPILEQLTAVLDEHSVNFAGPVAEALDRLRSTATETSMAISAANPRDARADTTAAPVGSRCTPPPWCCRLTCCCVRPTPVVPSTASWAPNLGPASVRSRN